VNTSAGGGSPGRAGYRQSAGSPRREARRRELLGRVDDDLAVNGLAGFSYLAGEEAVPGQRPDELTLLVCEVR
jgi:hypothetical protein